MTDNPKSQGQLDYEADLAARPHYHDGLPRRTWVELGWAVQQSWERGHSEFIKRESEPMDAEDSAIIPLVARALADERGIRYDELTTEGKAYWERAAIKIIRLVGVARKAIGR